MDQTKNIRFYWTVLDLALLSDAESTEDESENVVVGSGARDLVEWPQGVVEIHQDHLMRNLVRDRRFGGAQRTKRIVN